MWIIRSLLAVVIVFSMPAFSAETLYLPLDIHGKPGNRDSGFAVSATALLADSFTITHKEKGVFEIKGLKNDSAPAELQSIVTLLKKTSTRSEKEIRASDDLFAVADGTAARFAQGARVGFRIPVGSTIKVNGLFSVNKYLIMPVYYEYQRFRQHTQIAFYCENSVCRFSDFDEWPVARVWLAKGAIIMVAREIGASLEYAEDIRERYEIIVPTSRMSNVHAYLDIERHDIVIKPDDSVNAGRYRDIREFFKQGKERAGGTFNDFSEFLVEAFRHESAAKQGYSSYRINKDGNLKSETVFVEQWKRLLSDYTTVRILGSTPVTGGEFVWTLLKMQQGGRVLMVLPLLKTENGLKINLLGVTTTAYLFINLEPVFAAVWEYLLQEPVTFIDGEVPYTENLPEQSTNTVTKILLVAGFIILIGGLALLWRHRKNIRK